MSTVRKKSGECVISTEQEKLGDSSIGAEQNMPGDSCVGAEREKSGKGRMACTRIRLKMIVTIILSLILLMICMRVGSVYISFSDTIQILRYEIFGSSLPETLDPSMVSILWTIRMPRAVTAFLAGGMLSVSGAVMQAVLQNPLASSYTLGVSSGASLGAALTIVGGISIPVLGQFMLPASGFIFGLGTVLLVLGVSSRFDQNASSHTVILFGMVVSLFMNALLTLVSSMNSEYAQRLLMWQMGSFSGKRWYHAAVLTPCAIIGILLTVRRHRELDIMTFGDEQAFALGINLRHVKRMLLALSAFLTGVTICFTGTIGFVDLIVPHIVRRIFGASSRYVITMSFFVGGAFLTLADLAARMLLSPREIPVGAVTALIGAPFFVWVYFGGSRRKAGV